MRLAPKIILPIVLALAVMIAGMGLFLFRSIQESLYYESFLHQQESTSWHIANLLSADLFDLNHSLSDDEQSERMLKFQAFSLQVRDSSVGRLTLWNTDRVILYSDLSANIGKQGSSILLQETIVSGAPRYIYRKKDIDTPQQSNFGAFIDVFLPVIIDGRVRGVIEMHLPSAAITAPITREAKVVVMAFVVMGFFLGLAVFFVMKISILNPLSRLGRSVQDISRGKLDTDIHIPHTKDEIYDLATDFARMRIALRSVVFDIIQKKQVAEEAQKEMKDRLAQIEQMNTLMVNRELAMVALKKENDSLKKKIDAKVPSEEITK